MGLIKTVYIDTTLHMNMNITGYTCTQFHEIAHFTFKHLHTTNYYVHGYNKPILF